jgi:hypothetical protein
MSYKINRFLFYLSAVLAALFFLMLTLNIYQFDIPVGDPRNIGMIGSWIGALLVSMSQFLEWKRKANLG